MAQRPRSQAKPGRQARNTPHPARNTHSGWRGFSNLSSDTNYTNDPAQGLRNPAQRGARSLPGTSQLAAAKKQRDEEEYRAAQKSSASIEKKQRGLERLRRTLRRHLSGKPTSSSPVPNLLQATLGLGGMVFKLAFVVLVLVGSLGMGLGLGMLNGYFSTAQEIDVIDLSSINKKSVILDKNGTQISQLSGAATLSEFVSMENLQDSFLPKAFIAIEDERFLTHPGIDFRRIASAVFGLVTSGNVTHGGSTITQQTVKLLTGKNDISAQRKIQEWYNAVRLEKGRSKESIMELYLNLVPMSNNVVGVQAASQVYFNKKASELTLAEAAFLAGIPNQPSICNPLTEYGRRNALRRSRFILAKMLELGSISSDQYLAALNEELNFDFSFLDRNDEEIQSYFVDYVIEQVQKDLVKRLGYSPSLANIAVYNNGFTIESTLDPKVQKKCEEVFKNKSLFVQDPSQIPDSPEEPQAAITILDNGDDEFAYIRGMVGGYGEKKANFIFNRAVDAKRQPGSSIKPLVVYTPALETGKISMATPLMDRPLYLDSSRPTTPYPLNYYRSYWGPQTLESALVNSINTIAADIYVNYITPSVGLSYLKQSGIDRTDEPYVSGALGGFAHGMSTLDMAGAYSVLANKGRYREPIAYTRVLDSNGNVILDNTQNPITQVYREETTSVMTKLLEAVAKADHNKAVCSNTVTAGKTGTTEDYTDIWFCGYTPYYTAAVWYGYDNANGRRTLIPLVDGKDSVFIWRACMQAIHEGLPPKDFYLSPGVITQAVDPKTGLLAPGGTAGMPMYFIPNSPANPSVYAVPQKDPRQRELDPNTAPQQETPTPPQRQPSYPEEHDNPAYRPLDRRDPED